MVILNQNSFKLPRVEKRQFISLLRLGLEYDQTKKTYRISNYNNIGKLVDTLSYILNENEISFLQTCLVCNINFPCSECNYTKICTTKDLPFECICPACLKKEKNYNLNLKL